MTVTIMIDGSVKRNGKFGFKLQSSHVIEKHYNLPSFIFLVQDSKYGFGGAKRGLKRNSQQSFSDVSSFNSSKHSKAPRAKAGNAVSDAGKEMYTFTAVWLP